MIAQKRPDESLPDHCSMEEVQKGFSKYGLVGLDEGVVVKH